RTALYPFLPFSSQKVHEYLGFPGNVESDGWQPRFPEPGRKLLPPKALFTKLDEKQAELETSRIGS
ncbi:MAG: methionine--tRNA ligase, partial [Chloroflexota bacterium]|nr:methionine--tRNA ligase [Chloroflexota bacterium]